jgi:acyl-CoA reductase-like NAD-dependent aldehyde dehydrogenase
MTDRDDRGEFYIGGAWVPSKGAETIDVVNAAAETVMASVPAGTSEDVESAVESAGQAFPEWSRTPVEDRAKFLGRIAEGLQARTTEIATLVSLEVGTTINMSLLVHVGLPTITFSALPGMMGGLTEEEQIGNSRVVREPVGVVAAITPWNYPLHQAAAKVAPALAAGCTVVLKPSELAPLSAFVLADVVNEVGLPPGVFNLVTGMGDVVGEALATHPGVDMVSFTGSLPTGRRVGELAARSVKRVVLELGGKASTVILDDADLSQAVPSGVTSAFLNSGQTCLAQSRMLVRRGRLSEAEEVAVATAEALRVGDPLDERTRIGPLVSHDQRERVRGQIVTGLREGAKLLTGGPEPPDGLPRGYYVRPTVFSAVRSEMSLAREEMFGPVLGIQAYDSEDEAVTAANDNVYGLSGAVWSSDWQRAERVARRLRMGHVEINGGMFNPLAPFGGYKQSGNGRELGRFALDEYLELKALQL